MEDAPLVKDGLLSSLDMSIVSATSDSVVLQWTIRPKHHQPMGIVHGGVYCSAIESACSIGAWLSARERDPNAAAVGLENHTSFVRAVREGTLRCTARPITRGRRTQLWEADVRDAEGKVIATGRVRLLCVSGEGGLG